MQSNLIQSGAAFVRRMNPHWQLVLLLVLLGLLVIAAGAPACPGGVGGGC